MKALVNLIDPVLVHQQAVCAFGAPGHLAGHGRLAAIKQVGQEPAGQADDHGDDAEENLLACAACRVGRCADNGLEEAANWSPPPSALGMPIQPPATESTASRMSGANIDQGLSCGWCSPRVSPKKVRYQRRNM